jgi:lipopolysaccharide biosynthesis glycosyltransferase
MMGYQGSAIFMDCDMLCRGDIAELWAQRVDSFALLCVQHDHQTSESKKFLGESRAPTSKRTGAA